MIKVIISGCSGFMGKILANVFDSDDSCKVVAGFDPIPNPAANFPIFSDPFAFKADADVLVDFSTASALERILDFSLSRSVPLVLCTTGHSVDQLNLIKAAANRIPIFKSANMSIGINLLLELVKRAAFVLGDNFDIEILEKHHNRKLDAPSGTALMLANAAKDGKNYSPDFVFDRSNSRQPRSNTEIGISALRAGSIPGEHSVFFAGPDEVIEFKHTVFSREVFAAGALRAAKFLANSLPPGIYDMSDVLQDSF